MEVRTRFAPSPTGYLHIGGLRTALYAYLFAKKNGGKFILRIEDTDVERYVEGAEEIIYSSLKDSGLYYDEGPDVGGEYGPYIQSQRKSIYLEYAEKLIKLKGAYRCFCTKERLESLTDKNGQRKYDKHCLNLSEKEIQEKLDAGVPYVIRQNMPVEGTSSYIDLVYGEITVDNKELEDNVLIKSDGMPTYNFANVIDDHLMKINYVIRGIEYLSSTPKYNLLYDSFGWEKPQYIHLPPVMRDAQHKLSKRYGDPSFNDLVGEGFLKEALINYIALLGWSPKDNREKLSFDELKELFSIEGLSKSPAIFDKQKLSWLNGEYIREMSPEDFNARALPFYEKSKVRGLYDYNKLSRLLQGRIEVFSQIPEKINFIEEFDRFDVNLYIREKQKSTKETALAVLPEAIKAFEGLTIWENDAIFAALKEVAAAAGVKSGAAMWCVRVALTGRETTPGGASEIAELLGKDRTLKRLRQSLLWLKD
jgi:glutamyl-tRNA synthetase